MRVSEVRRKRMIWRGVLGLSVAVLSYTIVSVLFSLLGYTHNEGKPFEGFDTPPPPEPAALTSRSILEPISSPPENTVGWECVKRWTGGACREIAPPDAKCIERGWKIGWNRNKCVEYEGQKDAPDRKCLERGVKWYCQTWSPLLEYPDAKKKLKPGTLEFEPLEDFNDE